MATSKGSGMPPKQAVKFARRTSSGRVVSLSRDDDIDMSGDVSGKDFTNYTVMMPPTPDNQPGANNNPASGDKPDGPNPYGTSRFQNESQRRRTSGVDENSMYGGGSGGGGGNASGKIERRMSLMKSNSKSMLLRSQTTDFDHNRWLFETKGKYGIGNAYWEEDSYDQDTGIGMSDFMDKPWKPLTRKIHVPPAILSPYRFTFLFPFFPSFLKSLICIFLSVKLSS